MRRMASCLKLYLFAFVFQLSGEVNVVFRFDDYAENSDTEKELKIIDAFRSADVPVTFGVIPFACISNYKVPSPRESIPLQGEKANILKQAYEEGIMEVALHGCNHQTWFSSHLSEFKNVEYFKQKEMIAKGKAHLERIVGVPVETFVPPWNSYDINTVRALNEIGFTTLSASFGGEADPSYNINMIPWTAELSDVKKGVELARASGIEHSLIVAVFHLGDLSWGTQSKDKFNIHELPNLLEWLNSQSDVNVLTIRELSTEMGSRGISWYLTNNLNLKLNRYLPSFMKRESMLYFSIYGMPNPANLIVSSMVMFVCSVLAIMFASRVFRKFRKCNKQKSY